MKSFQLVSLCIALALAMGGALSAAVQKGDAQKGKPVFEQSCATCHGPLGRGDGPTGKMLVPQPADLTAASVQKKSDAELLNVIRNGKPPTAMPAFKGLLGDEALLDAVAYLRELPKMGATPSSATPPPAAPVSGPPAGSQSSFFRPPALEDVPATEEGNAIRYGYEIVVNTQQHVKDYLGNALSCRNCHLDAGRVPHAGPFVGVYPALPEYRARNAKMTTIEMRINDCFERSMNGKKLPSDSLEMDAVIAYMAWLSQGIPVGTRIPERGFPRIKSSRRADPLNGRQLYVGKCAVCHGAEGQGTATAPPVWGPGSYNQGAGMARLSIAASFIKRNMPLGQGGTLSDDEAWDLAAFINSRPRPEFAGRAQDWPKGGKPDDIVY
jgi:thiosulfate dehydrogenase